MELDSVQLCALAYDCKLQFSTCEPARGSEGIAGEDQVNGSTARVQEARSWLDREGAGMKSSEQ